MNECNVYSPDSQLACQLDITHEGWHQADGSQWHGNQWGISSYDDTQAAPTTAAESHHADTWDIPTQRAEVHWPVTPTPPPTPPIPPLWWGMPPKQPKKSSVATAVPIGGCNHALHAIATVMTLGLWWPIWMVAALFGRRRLALIDKHGKVVAYRRL